MDRNQEYVSVRTMAQSAGVSVQAVYKWIEKRELPAEVVHISEYEKRYLIPRAAAAKFLSLKNGRSQKGPGRSRRSLPARTLAGRGQGLRPKPRTGAELVSALQKSGSLGMWKDRTDLGDSREFARELRGRAQRRKGD